MITPCKGLVFGGVVVLIALVSGVVAVVLTADDEDVVLITTDLTTTDPTTASPPTEETDAGLTLSIIHLNDFHARFDETSTSSGACKEDSCIGGFSRVYTAVNDLRSKRINPIFLNAGDNFQGTLWYNIFKWNVTSYFLNMLEADATTLGNHEFDDKIAGVVPFLETLKSPVVVSNIDDSLEPSIQGLYNKSTIIIRDGKKIGIVGVILSTTNEIASTEKLKFLDESESVNAEAKRLLEEEGVFTVIVLSHCGYEVEQSIAAKAIPGISVVVGAHSHTLLYDGIPPNGEAYGPYPTVITHEDGRNVLVVQASSYTKYLGDIVVDYDGDGEVVDWRGSPLYLDESILSDPAIDELLSPWKEEVDEYGSEVLGFSKVLLDQSSCRYNECSLGNFITDAMVAYHVEEAEEGSWTYAAIGIINAGGIRTSIDPGEITFNDLATAQPFGNTVDSGELQGKYIKEIMETAAMPYNSKRVYADVNLMQVSGIHVVMDLSKPEGSRITSLKVRCNSCNVPTYVEVEPETYYRIALGSFLVTGGDGYAVITDNIRNHKVGPVDTDIFIEYIRQQSPIITGLDERITIIGDVQALAHG